eukprot:gene3863-4221_t
MSSSSPQEKSSYEIIGKIGLVLRIISLLAIIICAIYIECLAIDSNNWDNTREMGLAQNSLLTQCIQTNRYHHHIDRVEITNSTNSSSSYYLPLLMRPIDADKPCVSDDLLNTHYDALSKLDVGTSVKDFSKMFSRNHTHCYQSFFILVAWGAFISLILTLVYECGNYCFPGVIAFCSFMNEEGRFSYLINMLKKRVVVRSNILLVAAIAIMLVVSSLMQSFVLHESCEYLYHSDEKNFCDSIQSAGLTVVSLISPKDVIVSKTPIWSFVLAVLLFATIICQCVIEVKLEGGRIYPQHSGESPIFAEIHSGLFRENIRAATDHFMVYWFASDSRELSARSYITEKTILPWKLIPTNELPNESECSICLSAFSSKGGDDNSCACSIRSACNLHASNKNSSRVFPLDVGRIPTITLSASYSQSIHGVGGYSTSTLGLDPSHERQQSSTDLSMMEEGRLPSSSVNAIVRVACGHIFHEGCISRWLISNLSCPICRAELVLVRHVRPRRHFPSPFGASPSSVAPANNHPDHPEAS